MRLPLLTEASCKRPTNPVVLTASTGRTHLVTTTRRRRGEGGEMFQKIAHESGIASKGSPTALAGASLGPRAREEHENTRIRRSDFSRSDNR
jgi:hypothetical protein